MASDDFRINMLADMADMSAERACHFNNVLKHANNDVIVAYLKEQRDDGEELRIYFASVMLLGEWNAEDRGYQDVTRFDSVENAAGMLGTEFTFTTEKEMFTRSYADAVETFDAAIAAISDLEKENAHNIERSN